MILGYLFLGRRCVKYISSMEPERENMMTLRQETKRNDERSRILSGIEAKTIYKARVMSEKGI